MLEFCIWLGTPFCVTNQFGVYNSVPHFAKNIQKWNLAENKIWMLLNHFGNREWCYKSEFWEENKIGDVSTTKIKMKNVVTILSGLMQCKWRLKFEVEDCFS